MGRPARTLPYAVASGGDPKFSPTTEEWKHIERAYGPRLTDQIRQEIVAATTNFLLFEPFERAAERVSLERRNLQTVQRAVETLYDAIVRAPATTATAREIVQRLPSLAGECASQLARLDDPNLPGRCEGACWEDWVLALTQIAKQHRLPAGVRTDTDKNWLQSKFVVLVHELQQRLPPEARRHEACDAPAEAGDALAKAIQRARARARARSRRARYPSE